MCGFQLRLRPRGSRFHVVAERVPQRAEDPNRHSGISLSTAHHLEKTDNMMADDKSKAVERHKMIKCRSFQLNAHAMNE